MTSADRADSATTEPDTQVAPQLTAYTEITVTHRDETEDQP
jgi:hypothetical protein